MTEETMFLAEGQAIVFPEMDRVEVDEDKVAPLTESDPDWDEEWAREAEDRLAACDRAEVGAFDLDEVMPQLKVEYGWT